jgi:phosphatidylglycerophosphatase A
MSTKLRNLLLGVASLGFVGYSPIIPGTLGSIVGVGVWYFLSKASLFYFTFLLLFFFLGVEVSKEAEKVLGEKDSSKIVIDEFWGALIFYHGLPFNLYLFLFGFLIYRIFDIVKIPPANFAQRLKNGWGVMLDDGISALWTNIFLRIIKIYLTKRW